MLTLKLFMRKSKTLVVSAAPCKWRQVGGSVRSIIIITTMLAKLSLLFHLWVLMSKTFKIYLKLLIT